MFWKSKKILKWSLFQKIQYYQLVQQNILLHQLNPSLKRKNSKQPSKKFKFCPVQTIEEIEHLSSDDEKVSPTNPTKKSILDLSSDDDDIISIVPKALRCPPNGIMLGSDYILKLITY